MKELIFDTFIRDARVIEARRLLMEALEANQVEIRSIAPPDPERKDSYLDSLKGLAAARVRRLPLRLLATPAA